MKAVVQRVKTASVSVDGKTVSEISHGYLVLLGVMNGDTEKQSVLLASKIAELRVFCDENEKMNLSVKDVSGEILVVSQFTLCADVSHGRRPSFTPSAPPEQAKELYRLFCEELKNQGVSNVETGIFGADMEVSLVNDGPVTIIMNTDEWRNSK